MGAVPSGPPEGTLLLAVAPLAGWTWVSSFRQTRLLLTQGVLRDLAATPVGLTECLADLFLMVAGILPAAASGWFAARILLVGDRLALVMFPVLVVFARFNLWRISAAACLAAVAGNRVDVVAIRQRRERSRRAAGRCALAVLYLAPAALAAVWPSDRRSGGGLPMIALTLALAPAAAATIFVAARRLKKGHGLALSDFSPFATRRETRAAIERRAEL